MRLPNLPSIFHHLYSIRKSDGFTLLELLIVISVMGIAFVAIIPNLGRYSDDQKLKDHSLGLLTVIKKAQANAASGLTCNTSAVNKKAISWNVKFLNNNSYTLEPSCVEGTSSPVETISLKDNIVINSINYCGFDYAVFNGSSISFANISAATSFNIYSPQGGVGSIDCNKFSIQLANLKSTKNVIIEPSGVVYIEEGAQ